VNAETDYGVLRTLADEPTGGESLLDEIGELKDRLTEYLNARFGGGWAAATVSVAFRDPASAPAIRHITVMSPGGQSIADAVERIKAMCRCEATVGDE
jgi:hypothetical protein